MRLLLLILLIIACEQHDIIKIKIVELTDIECQRLINDSYDSLLYPKDECRCIFIMNNTIREFSHKWSPYEYQKYLDSLNCGYNIIQYDIISIQKEDVIINGDTLKCDC